MNPSFTGYHYAYKPVALGTGANKGIGLQIAMDLVAQGFSVLVGSRSLAAGETAAKSIGAEAYVIQLDVTEQGSITSAARRISGTSLAASMFS